MRKLLPVVVSGFLLFGAAACGDDDDEGGGGDLSSDEQEFVDAAMADFDPEEAEPLTEDDARCVVVSMVDALGVERLEEVGLTPESFADEGDDSFPSGLEEAEANRVVDGFEGCFDMSQLFLDQMADDESLSPEARECLAEAFDEDFTRRIFVTMLTKGEDALEEDEELTSELFAAISQCPEVLSGG
jgi:hypothetical protein